MNKPDLNNIWETAIRIPGQPIGIHMQVLQTKVIPVIKVLRDECAVQWYCFLIHNSQNGVPIPYSGLQFHIRFENSAKLGKEKLRKSLPPCCEMIRNADAEDISKIAGIDTNLLKDNDIAEAWKITGESCKWVVEMLNIYKAQSSIPWGKMAQQIGQFQHYIANITGVSFR